MIMPRRRLITVSVAVLCGSMQYHVVGKRMGSGIGSVRPEPGENKQVQTQAVSRLYSHQCGRQDAGSERGTIRQLALKVKTKSSV